MDGGELPSDEQLIAWHAEELTGVALAEREGIDHKWLLRGWDRLRRAGRIEPGGRGQLAGGRPWSPPNHDGDGRPTVGWDPLLDKLIEVFGEPRADLVDLTMKDSGKKRRRRAT